MSTRQFKAVPIGRACDWKGNRVIKRNTFHTGMLCNATFQGTSLGQEEQHVFVPLTDEVVYPPVLAVVPAPLPPVATPDTPADQPAQPLPDTGSPLPIPSRVIEQITGDGEKK